jgi:hypothetical protein
LSVSHGGLSYLTYDPIDAASASASAAYAASHNASLAFKGAAHGLVASNGSSVTLEWVTQNLTEFSNNLATLTYTWHSGVWCCNRSSISSVVSNSINPTTLSYSLSIPSVFLPGSRWLLTLNISSKSNVVPAKTLLHISEANKRALSPTVIVEGTPGVGSGIDTIAFGGVGIDAKGSQGTIFGGGTIKASTRAYGFKANEQIEFYFYRSVAGETCSLDTNYSLCLPRQGCTSTGPPTLTPTVKWPLGLTVATTRRFLQRMTLGVINTTLSDPVGGEFITITYTLPEVDDDLFTPNPFYIVGALWYNASTIELNGKPTSYTLDGLPENATSRSPCFAVYGTEEGTFPSILNVQVPSVIVGSPTTLVKVTWDVAASLLPSTPAFRASRFVLSLYEAGKTQRVAVIDWNVPNTGVYWWSATDALVNIISENIAGPRQYYLLINSTLDSFISVYGKSKTFAIADGGQNIDIILLPANTTTGLFTYANATRAFVAIKPSFFSFGDAISLGFSALARIDRLWGATSFVPNAFYIDVICSLLSDFSDAAQVDSFTSNQISVNTLGDTRQSVSISRNYTIPGPDGTMKWPDFAIKAPSFLNGLAGLPENGTCWLSVYTSRNRFRRALSSPFAIQSTSAAARIPSSFSVTFMSPVSNRTFVSATGSFINMTYMIEAPANSLPYDLSHLTVSLYRFTGNVEEPITISNIQKVNLNYQIWKNELGDVDTICLRRPCGYDIVQPVVTSLSEPIRFTRFIQLPSSLVIPGNNYFLVVSSPVPSYRNLRLNGPLFSVMAHRIFLSDDQHFCNNTLFHGAAATRPSFNIECNLTSTLPANYAKDNQLDMYLLYANRGSSWTPEADLSAGILPPVAAVLSLGNPGKGYLRSGNIFWSATNFTYGVNFTVPNNIELNQVYIFCVRNARYNAYAWSYFYVGNFDDNDANLGKLDVATPIENQIIRAGNVLIVQWTSYNVMFDTGILVKLVDINGGVLAVLSPDASNVEATQRWLIPASFCGGARSYVCGPNETASTTVKIRVESQKTDAVFGNSRPFYIYPPLNSAYIAVASPVFKSIWYNGTSALVMWTTVGIPTTAKCSVSLMRHRYFLAAGDEFVATLSAPGGLSCASGKLTVTPPFNSAVGFPVYVVIAQLNSVGVWDTDSYWGRSDLFTLTGTAPTPVLQIVQAACEMSQLGGLPASLCKKDCAVCKGGAWVSAATVSLDFDFPYWPFNSYDLVILKRALGAIRSTNLNLCWPGNTDTSLSRVTAEKVYISTDAVPLYASLAPLLPSGVTVRPFLRLEYGGLGPQQASCSLKYAQSNIPITAVTGYSVSAERAAKFALVIQQSLMRMANLGPASIDVSVDTILSADATKSASGEGVGLAGLTAGTLPQVSLLDQVTGNKVALPDAASPEDMRRRMLSATAASTVVAPPTSRLEAAAIETLRKAAAYKRLNAVTRSGALAESYERARRMQEFTPLPTGPPVVTLVRMSARIALVSSDLLREVNNIALLDGLIDAENKSSLFDFGTLGQASVVFGVAKSYPGGSGSALSSWDNIFSSSTDVYAVDFSSADTGQPTAATGSLQSILSRTAWTDGTANFQVNLYAYRRRPGPPRPLSPGEIAAIVISILFILWFVRFLYYDFIHRVYFFPAPLVELPPVAGEPFDPTLKTIEQALAMHHETGHVIPDETVVPKDDRYAVRSITKAVMASASPIPHDVGPRGLGASSPARVHPHPSDASRLAAKQKDREAAAAAAAAAEALEELV